MAAVAGRGPRGAVALAAAGGVAAALAAGAAAATAGEWDTSAAVAAELRLFPRGAAFPGQRDSTLSPSLAVEPELVYQWNDGGDRLTAVPFARLDGRDDKRSHLDLRELNYLHIGDDWDLLAGLDRVFWGVAESRHLVDVINQTDGVEDIDEEDKLGQPMVNLRLLRDWGTLSLFVLPGFRERIFPDDDARLRGALPVDEDATYDSGAGRRHVDVAARWSHTFGDWDIGVSHFRGTSREPRLLPRRRGSGRLELVPHYDQIDQTGLDLQLTREAWLWKLEAITRGGHGDRFLAAVAGFEHTLYQVFDSDADIGLLAEYLYDGRGEGAPPTFAADDIFVGARLALNDPQDSSALAGAIVDRDSGGTVLFLEAERRLGSSWRLELEARLFVNVPDADVLAGIRDDDVITLRLTKYF